jgi:hypothetical protein
MPINRWGEESRMYTSDHDGRIGPYGTVAAGSGELISGTGTSATKTTVTSPIALGDGNHRLVDNETDAIITGGNGNNFITERGAGASITLGDGNNVINDAAGTATVVTGTGDQFIDLGGTGNSVTVGATNGGSYDVTVIIAGTGDDVVMGGDGNLIIGAAGANNTITAGDGRDVFVLGGARSAGTAVATADVLNLGNGQNTVFLEGSGNTVNDGTGTDDIAAARGGADTFVINAGGGTQVISGFSLTNGDTIDLSQILAGTTADAADIGRFVTLTTEAVGHHGMWANTVLTINGSGGTDTITLLNTGTITLASLTQDNLKI